MDKGVFRYVLRYSLKDQLFLLAVAIGSLPFYYWSLSVPKTIIDKAIKGGGFPYTYMGIEFDQIGLLAFLCAMYLVLIFINGQFKYVVNTFRGASGERMLRRLRFQILQQVLRFPLPAFRKTSQGEVVSMVNQETEPLGGFFGESISLPAYQGGLLLTLMIFMFMQDWRLGIAAVALYPLQALLIPKMQKKVQALGRERNKTVRKLAERIGETVTGADEIHANDTSQYELADISSRLGRIYSIRFDIYKRKFAIKGLNNFISLMTPFFFYSIGGYLVITGHLTVGALTAVLAAYKDVSAPWKMLLDYYHHYEDSEQKYETLTERFNLPNLLDEELLTADATDDRPLTGRLTVSNLTLMEDDGLKVIDGASMAADLPSHIALVGASAGGKNEFAQILARLLFPTSGRFTIGDRSVLEMPEAITGRRISYADQAPYMLSGSIRDNLLYGVKHRPIALPSYEGQAALERKREQMEAMKSGNIDYDMNADWIDYRAMGATGPADVTPRLIHYLKVARLEEDVFQIGLRQCINPKTQATLAERLLTARRSLRARLDEQQIADFIESFDKEKFNSNASVAENILFGTPVGDAFSVDKLGENSYVLSVLAKVGLNEDFLTLGHRLAEIMVDLFQGLPPEHEFWERFSFISAETLPEFQGILKRVAQDGRGMLSEEERSRLRALPFRLIPARHHVGLIDAEFEGRVLEARHAFAEGLPAELRKSVEFFDAEKYSGSASIQDNILFGKLASERAESGEKVGEVLAEVVAESGLRQDIVDLGLDYQLGIGGTRMSLSQRQRLALARALLKNPDILIVNEALSAMDADMQTLVVARLRDEMEGRTLIMVMVGRETQEQYDYIFRVEGGKVANLTAGASRGDTGEAKPSESSDGSFGDEVDVLSRIPFLAGLPRARLKLLSFASERFSYEAGEEVFHQGDIGDKAYIVIDGEADVVLETLDGPRRLVSLKRGSLFGELALLCDAPRTASIVAAKPLTLMSISKDIFFKLLAEDADVSARLTRSVAMNLERTTRDLSMATTVRDSVTNLPDKRLFNDRMRLNIARNRRFNEGSGLLWFDTKKNFGLNGSLTKEQSAKLLRAVADRISASARDTDTAARVDDTNFAIIVAPAHDERSHELLAQRLTNALASPIDIGGTQVQLRDEVEFRYRPLENDDPDLQLKKLMAGEGTAFTLRGPLRN